jgi:hypothetical protein
VALPEFGDASFGRHFVCWRDALYATDEIDASDDFLQLVFTFELEPGIGRRGDELEYHQFGGGWRERLLSSCGTVAKALSLGLVVRTRGQCSAGKSYKASKTSRSFSIQRGPCRTWSRIFRRGRR